MKRSVPALIIVLILMVPATALAGISKEDIFHGSAGALFTIGGDLWTAPDPTADGVPFGDTAGGLGLGGGVFPMAALIAREDLDVAGRTALGHFTHEKSPVGCAAALATIEVIEEKGLCARAAELGDHATARLREAQQSYPIIHEVRGLGLQLGVELRRADGSRATDEAEQVMYAALERGLSFKTTMGSILTLTPPLTVTRDELDRAIDILVESISAL